MRQGERTDVEPSVNLPKVSQTQAAQLLNVSERSVATAKQVQEKAVPELVEQITQGKVAVSTAAVIAELESLRASGRYSL